MNSTNPRDVAYMFRDYARSIHKKSNPADPNFIRISVACAKVRFDSIFSLSLSSFCPPWYDGANATRHPQIEQWAEHQFPSFVRLASDSQQSHQQTLDPSDARTRIAKLAQERDIQLARLRASSASTNGNGVIGKRESLVGGGTGGGIGEVNKELVLFLGGAVLLIVMMSLLVVGVVLYFTS